MIKDVFFSVVIPIYNKEPYIFRAINSVLQQTFQDFEIIVICDPSSDNSNDEVLKFKDDHIRVFYRDEAGPGGYAARNLGIKKSHGEWVAFLDADDEWYPDHLKKMYELSKTYPQAYFLGSGWEIYSPDGIFNDSFYNNNADSRLLNVEDYFNFCLKNKRPVHTSVSCIKKSSPVALNLFPSESTAKRGGDLNAWLKIICHHKEMAWSNHIGVRYYLDVEGQTVKTAISTPELMAYQVYAVLSQNLDSNQKKLLRKLFNRYLRNAWFGNIIRNNKNFPIVKFLYFKGDFIKSIFLSILSFFPGFLLRFLHKVKVFLNDL